MTVVVPIGAAGSVCSTKIERKVLPCLTCGTLLEQGNPVEPDLHPQQMQTRFGPQNHRIL